MPCLLLVWALGFGAGVAQEAPPSPVRPRPDWEVPEAPSRLVVRRGGDDFFLVRLEVPEGVRAARAFAAAGELPARTVWAEGCVGEVLVDARTVKPGLPVRVYPAPAAGAAAAADPAPVRGVARRTAGMDFPSSLADVGMLETRCEGRGETFTVADFSGLGETFKGWYRGDWTRKSHLVDLQTWLFVPADGKFLFGLAGVAPAWLLVDGVPVMEHPANQPYDKWTAGGEVALKAGLRQVRVRTVVREKIDTGLAWKRAGESGVAKDVVMVTGGDRLDGRWERPGRRLHPYAEVVRGQAYRFAGLDEVFEPFSLRDGSASWGTNHVVSWTVGGVAVGDGPSQEVTLRRSALPASLALLARAGNGEEARAERVLEGGGPVWAEYEVSTRVVGLPAVCYGDDRVQPIIRVRTSAADGLGFELVAETVRRDGSRVRREERLTTDRGWARVYLDAYEAGGLERVEWSLRHAGAELSRGAAAFLHEPYARLPDAVSGETLKGAGESLVLVASRASRGDPAPGRSPASASEVAFLDGFVYGGAGGVAPGGGWRVVDVRALEASEGAPGRAGLLPFAAVKGALPAAALVYAPSFLSVSGEGGVEGFERRLAAMAALLSSPACGAARVLLVVPPAFDVMPGCGCAPEGGVCPHAAGARAYAEAVMRVADAHGVETVDLFTAFRTDRSGAVLVSGGGLTPAGVALAEGLVARKLGLRTEKSATQPAPGLVHLSL